jgi:orotidine-5'-phosphate decarboxylase
MADAPAPTPARSLPAMPGRLIVALDLPTPEAARALVARLGDAVSFYKVGLGLLFARGAEALVDSLLASGRRVFLDAKMYDIGETVRRGVARAAERGISLVTVHGDPEIMRAAVAGRGGAALQVFAISVLTSQDEAATRAMGYGLPLPELLELRVRNAVAAGCDGIIASAADDPNAIRARVGAPGLLIATPGIRPPGTATDDHRRHATPAQAIAAGADYLVVGRPILKADDPAAMARAIVADMERGAGEGPTI